VPALVGKLMHEKCHSKHGLAKSCWRVHCWARLTAVTLGPPCATANESKHYGNRKFKLDGAS
jgi:hypothetical protein